MHFRKFRGKSIVHGQWLFGDLVHLDEKVYVVPVNKLHNIEQYEVKPETVRESTGLKDLKGQSIFNDDIVEYLDGEYSFLAIVKWDEFVYYMEGIVPDDNFHFHDTDSSELTVVGNVHDNPGLLEMKGEDIVFL